MQQESARLSAYVRREVNKPYFYTAINVFQSLIVRTRFVIFKYNFIDIVHRHTYV